MKKIWSSNCTRIWKRWQQVRSCIAPFGQRTAIQRTAIEKPLMKFWVPWPLQPFASTRSCGRPSKLPNELKRASNGQKYWFLEVDHQKKIQMIKEAQKSWKACRFMNFGFDHVLITMCRWFVRGYVSCRPSFIPNQLWHKAKTKNTIFCSKEDFFTHSLVDGQVRSYCNSDALQKPLVLELVKSSLKRFFSDSFMSSLTVVLVGTGDEYGGFVLQDCYLHLKDLLNLWNEVKRETRIATQKPFLLLFDQCYASRLSKKRWLQTPEPWCWNPKSSNLLYYVLLSLAGSISQSQVWKV